MKIKSWIFWISGIAVVSLLIIYVKPQLLGIYYLRKAKAACDQHLDEECIQFTETALKAHPMSSHVRWLLANLYSDNNRCVDAIPLYQWLIDRYPEYKAAFHNLGNCYRKLGQHEKALLVYQKAVAIKSDAWDSWYGIWLSQNSLGNTAEADLAFEKAYNLNPAYFAEKKHKV